MACIQSGWWSDSFTLEVFPALRYRFPVPVNLIVSQPGFTMKDASLHCLLAELEAFGAANDQAHQDRPRRMLNITRDTGELLAVLVRADRKSVV